MIINVHAGHNPDGKAGCGAVGIIRESTENRNVKNEVIRQLKALGHTVYDCTVDDGAAHGNVTAASDVLTKIVKNAMPIQLTWMFPSISMLVPRMRIRPQPEQKFIFAPQIARQKELRRAFAMRFLHLDLKTVV